MRVSTKRTHRFRDEKHGLSSTERRSYVGKISGKTVGSFWKTNPPGVAFCDPPGRFGPLLGRFGSEFRWALGIGRGMAGYLNLNGWLAASHL